MRPGPSAALMRAAYRCVEGSVVGFLEFGWWSHSDCRVKPAVGIPVDPAGGGVLDHSEGFERAVVEHGGADALNSPLMVSIKASS